MKTKAVACLTLAFLISHPVHLHAAQPYGPKPPCEIIRILTRLVIPRVDYKSVTVQEALTFIHHKYETTDDIHENSNTDFVFEYHLPPAVLEKRISLEAHDITMLEAIQRTLGDAPVSLTFEPGKLIFATPAPPPALVPKGR